ncbi:MAG: HAD hydrolase family protein [Acutalibacteraceae bacterium]
MTINKNYSDFLVVSDIDGTLNNKLRKTPKVNTEAIRRFTHELSGNFTLASARNVQSLKPHYFNLPDVKTPAIVLNGAGIYDFQKEKMVWFNSIPESGVEVLEKTLRKFSFLELGIFTDDMIYLVNPKIMSPVMMALDKLKHKKCRTVSEVPKGKWGKVIFFCYPWNKNKVKEFVLSQSDDSLGYIDTSIASFDMVNATTHKGNAVHVLADILGVPRENIGAIGDYFNDLDMLKTVSHPACCKQAPKELHDICEFHACHCNDGAVADFLKYIEKTY